MGDIDHIPASAFLQKLVQNQKRKKYCEWRSKFPEDWIELFVQQGLIPFLKKYGYKLGFTIEKCIQYTTTWAFLHVYTKDSYECKAWAHYGTINEYEWFQYKISQDNWSNLIDSWKVQGFLDNDDSESGYRQTNDLVWFVWHLIDLENSREHMRYLEYFEDNEEKNEEHYGYHQEDTNVYGGDRRTY
jgi:hypothetical protein